jgi:hypothetical protein
MGFSVAKRGGASLSDLGFRRVHVGAHYQYHDGKTFVSAAKVERAYARAERAAERQREEARAERAARREFAQTLRDLLAADQRREEARLARVAARAAEGFKPVPPPRDARPPAPEITQQLSPAQRSELLPTVPPVNTHVFSDRELLAYRQPIETRGSFYKYRDRDSGRFVSKEVYLALPPALRATIKRETHTRTGIGQLGQHLKPLASFLGAAEERGLSWLDVPDHYWTAAVRLSLV